MLSKQLIDEFLYSSYYWWFIYHLKAFRLWTEIIKLVIITHRQTYSLRQLLLLITLSHVLPTFYFTPIVSELFSLNHPIFAIFMFILWFSAPAFCVIILSSKFQLHNLWLLSAMLLFLFEPLTFIIRFFIGAKKFEHSLDPFAF